jgi:hypothetical protein
VQATEISAIPAAGAKGCGHNGIQRIGTKGAKPKPKRMLGKQWISEGIWPLIAKGALLLQSGFIWQDASRRMKGKIGVVVKADKCKLTTNVGNSIVTELAKGDIKEAFRHLKG